MILDQYIIESDMADSPNFFSSKFRGDRFADSCVHTARFSGNRHITGN